MQRALRFSTLSSASSLPVQPTRLVRPPKKIPKTVVVTSATMGFLFGLFVAGTSGWIDLVDTYRDQVSHVVRGISTLQQSLDKVKQDGVILNRVQERVATLEKDAFRQKQVEELRLAFAQSIDALAQEQLRIQVQLEDLRRGLADIEQSQKIK